MSRQTRWLWADALRSGKYKQGTRHLAQDDSYCCLGVLCELAVENGIIRDYNGRDADLDDYPEVVAWAGLQDPNGSWVGKVIGMDMDKGKRYQSLTGYNDGNCGLPKLNFDQIADVIDSEPEGLFADD